MMLRPVLLDTSFLLRFLNEDDPLFKNADAYFQHLLGKDIAMYLSTIAIAEYCAGGEKDQLPFHHVKVLPFNIDHAERAGAFRAAFVGQRLEPGERSVITNDVKLFAQADVTPEIGHFLTADERCKAKYDRLVEAGLQPQFTILSLRTPLHEVLGQLDL
ncbi:MAG: hypothetical protein QM724_14185 [Flavobacteriales bacterium]